MAKTREKSKKKVKDDKLSTGKKKKQMTPQELKFLSTDEKMQYLLENGHMIQDRLFKKVAVKRGIIQKDAFIEPETFMSKNGKLKKRKNHHLQFLDHILMDELKIDMNSKNNKHNINKTNGDNNNDLDISNQNNTVSSSKDRPKETEKTKDKSNSNLSELPVELSETITSSSTNPLSLEETHEHPKTDKDKTKKKNKKVDKETKELPSKRLQKLQTATVSTATVGLSRFDCDYCRKSFNTKSSLRRHINMHLNVKPFECRYCHMKFGQCCNWRSHMKNVHPKLKREKYICRKCRKPFLLKENLTLHLAAHIKKENSHKCVFCNKLFSTHLLLSQHEKQHMNLGRYKCSICTKSYDSHSRFSLHVKSHLEVKDLSCQYCGKQFLRPSSIKRHIQICHGGIRVQCPVCKKKLKGHLTEHMRTHENERPHECQECGQRFTQSTQLNVHKRSHTGARPYPCRICKRPFSHSNALMLHIRRHTGEKPFQCAMCHMSFSQLPHMKSHMRKIHGKEKYYKCGQCTTFFRLKAELEMHETNCVTKDKDLTFDEQVQASMESGETQMNISKMRFLLALLFTKIATKEKLKYLGFNKRLIDDILVESVEAMGHTPCTDKFQSPFMRLKTNISILMQGTVPKHDLIKFRESKKTIEELLELLTDDKK
ncbi:hypothetical protein MSG28_005256 [Choristoneura fumiferana]|uniref:Uncharacterized protein n=3 Tax=Choristoneura fumiferana TaxID=7141 RepID=A0ACC0JQH5_CHOFU|nr:hypothetical protein MSG28_005256 [Choristoneura fumiferana]